MEGKTCVSTCSEGLYKENASYTCEKCSVECITCTNIGSTNCTKCKSGWFLNGNSCLKVCPDPKYGYTLPGVNINTC